MGLKEDLQKDLIDPLSDAMLVGVDKVIDFLFQPQNNELLIALRYMIQYRVPDLRNLPVFEYIELIHVMTWIGLLLYYAYIAYRYDLSLGQLKARVRTTVDNRGIGLALLGMGMPIHMFADSRITELSMIFLNAVDAKALLAVSILFPAVRIFTGVAAFFLLPVIFIHIVIKTTGAMIIYALGLTLFLAPEHVLANKVLRLVASNLVLKLVVVFLLWFLQAVIIVAGMPAGLLVFTTPVFSLAAIYVMYSTWKGAWTGKWVHPYRNLMGSTKRAGKIAFATLTGGAKGGVVAAAATRQVETDIQKRVR